MKTEEDYDMEDLETLREKLQGNEELTLIELKKLLQITEKYDIRLGENEKEKLVFLKKKYSLNDLNEQYTELPEILILEDQKGNLKDGFKISRNQIKDSHTDPTPKGSI